MIHIVFGTFAPLHNMHMVLIKKAIENADFNSNDEVYVVVSGKDNDRGDNYGLNLDYRYLKVKEECSKFNLPNLKVVKLDENNIPTYPDGWNEWLDILDNITGEETDKLIYTGEPEYIEKINLLRPTWGTFQLQRFPEQISGTKIRNNPVVYYDYIADSFKPFFENKRSD